MRQPGGQGRKFFKDLMERQKGLKDFGPDDSINMLKGIASGSSKAQAAVQQLKRMLGQGGMDWRSTNRPDQWMLPEGIGLFGRGQEGRIPNNMIHNRSRQMDGARLHSRASRLQQQAKREDASLMDGLLSRI